MVESGYLYMVEVLRFKWSVNASFVGFLYANTCSCDYILPNLCKLPNVIIYRSLFVPEK